MILADPITPPSHEMSALKHDALQLPMECESVLDPGIHEINDLNDGSTAKNDPSPAPSDASASAEEERPNQKLISECTQNLRQASDHIHWRQSRRSMSQRLASHHDHQLWALDFLHHALSTLLVTTPSPNTDEIRSENEKEAVSGKCTVCAHLSGTSLGTVFT
jgi:hypothetical protein